MALHNLGFGPGNPGFSLENTLSGVPVVPGQLIAAKPTIAGPEASIQGTLPAAQDPGFLQKLLGLKADGSSLERILQILTAVSPRTSSSGGASGIGGLVGSILGLGKDK